MPNATQNDGKGHSREDVSVVSLARGQLLTIHGDWLEGGTTCKYAFTLNNKKEMR